MVISVRSFGAQNCQVESADALEYPAAGAYIFSFQEKMEMAGHLHVKYYVPAGRGPEVGRRTKSGSTITNFLPSGSIYSRHAPGRGISTHHAVPPRRISRATATVCPACS